MQPLIQKKGAFTLTNVSWQTNTEPHRHYLCKKIIQRVKLVEKSEKLSPFLKYFINFITKWSLRGYKYIFLTFLYEK